MPPHSRGARRAGGVSSRSIGEIERGRGRSPRPQTLERLAAALELSGQERAEFVGVGRATAWAVRVDRPDGRVSEAPQCQLRGTEAPADPDEVLGHVLRALGVEGSALPTGLDARAALFRARLANRRVLLLLDDAAGHRQVGSLLPAAGAAVLVTSRLPLTGLPGAISIDLGPLDVSTAVDLLCRVAGSLRVRAQPSASAELVAACGGLPLAVRIAAARLAARPHWTVSEFAERLAKQRRRLDELCYGDLAVRPGLQLAYRGLSPLAARAFALLGGLDVPSFTEWPLALLLDADPATGGATLEELLDARLVEGGGRDQAGQARYRLHDVTRLFARECRAAAIGHDEWVGALPGRRAVGWHWAAWRATACTATRTTSTMPRSRRPSPIRPRPLWPSTSRCRGPGS